MFYNIFIMKQIITQLLFYIVEFQIEYHITISMNIYMQYI